MVRSTFSLALLCAALVACTDDRKCANFFSCSDEPDAGDDDHDGGHDEGEVRAPSGAACPDDSDLTYETFGKDFIASYCLGCHSEKLAEGKRNGAPADHNFDTVELIRQQSDEIDETTAAGPEVSNSFMPPGSKKPTEAERKQLGEWLACGAK